MAESRVGNALALALFTIGLAASARAVDVVGTQVKVGWTAATGPVSGYYVIVARGTAAAKVESVTIDTNKTLSGTTGETLVVQVAAFAQDGVAGPLSPSSTPIKFVASGGGSGGGTTPPPGGTPPPTTPPPTNPPVPEVSVARDFNGDGTADLVVASGTSLRLWTMQGAHVASDLALPAMPAGARVVGTGDYDGNLSSDLLWENGQTGALTLWLLNAGVVSTTAALDRSSLPAGEEWRVGGSADLDGDGADDLMLFSRVKGEAEVWTFSGATVATRTRVAGHKGAWSVVAVDDTDGDGMGEIVWMDELNRVLELRDPNANAPVVLGNLGSGWRGRGGVDLEGDGSADLLVQNTANNATQGWTLDDAGILGSADLASAAGLGQFTGGGDFDGDGREDVAWSNVTSGIVTIWMSGGAPTRVDRALPSGGYVVSGSSSSDDGAFRSRFCSGDVDGNRIINANDFKAFKMCLNKQRTAACNYADMDSDGRVSATDYTIFKQRFTGKTCEAW